MMKSIRSRRRAATLGAVAAVAVAAAAGVAYASIPDGGKVFTACMLKNVGTIRLIDPALSSSNVMSHCTTFETQISFNEKGQQGDPGAAGAPGNDGKDGKDGTSVTSAALPPDDRNCPAGGSVFSSASGNTYACNGMPGPAGVGGPPDVFKGGCSNCGAVMSTQPVASLVLPAGKYAVWFKTRVFSRITLDEGGGCFLQVGTSSAAGPATTVDDAEFEVQAGEGTTVLMEAVVTLTAALPVRAVCGTNHIGVDVRWASPRLIAIPVGTINDQST